MVLDSYLYLVSVLYNSKFCKTEISALWKFTVLIGFFQVIPLYVYIFCLKAAFPKAETCSKQ
jgi:hypothetical protein